MKRIKRYMVVEHFTPGTKAKIYERFHQKGRMLPEGLIYIDSWLEKDGHRCFQLMETSDRLIAFLLPSPRLMRSVRCDTVAFVLNRVKVCPYQ